MTAAEEILRKKLVASDLPSDGWNLIQADLRNRAFFSARVTEARFLHEAREGVAQIAAGKRSASELRRDLRAVLDALGTPDGNGDITDPRTRRRLDLVIETNVRQARGYVNYLEGTTAGALAAFPAQELVRLFDRREKRPWPRIWELSGGKFYGGRMIALKSDPVWRRISRFGNPYPPFDWGSGMGVADVSREEAIRLGVIAPDDPPQKPPKRESMNDGLGISVPFRYDSPEYGKLRETFGDQIHYQNGLVFWGGSAISKMAHDDNDAPSKFSLGKFQSEFLDKLSATARAALDGRSVSMTASFFAHNRKHEGPEGISKGDYAMVPTMLRGLDEILERKGELLIVADCLDGSKLELGLSYWKSPTLTTFHRKKAPDVSKPTHRATNGTRTQVGVLTLTDSYRGSCLDAANPKTTPPRTLANRRFDSQPKNDAT